MSELFLQALAEGPPEVREKVVRQFEQALPEILRNMAGWATEEGDGEAMRFVLDLLQNGTPEGRRLMLEALGGGGES